MPQLMSHQLQHHLQIVVSLVSQQQLMQWNIMWNSTTRQPAFTNLMNTTHAKISHTTQEHYTANKLVCFLFDYGVVNTTGNDCEQRFCLQHQWREDGRA